MHQGAPGEKEEKSTRFIKTNHKSACKNIFPMYATGPPNRREHSASWDFRAYLLSWQDNLLCLILLTIVFKEKNKLVLDNYSFV